MPRNELSEASSPYLRQHANNPVHWHIWGEKALHEAQTTGKPILLSIGYAACHWCHVMAHESFESESTAVLMNELFVNIKVDREERPDIDHIYMSALHALGQQGGWPLTMFLTPEGEPFWGGTYFPNQPRYGQPSFSDVMKAVSRVYTQEPDRVLHNTRTLKAALENKTASESDSPLSLGLLDQLVPKVAQLFDAEHGGLKGAPKFPNPSILEFLWRAADRMKEPELRIPVLKSLEQMCQGGIYDHLAGGFSRYSVDKRWLVPHFEKMLYDNAQLLDLLALAWLETGNPLFQQRAAETVHWLLREMKTTAGAFAASLDADSEGEEGKFYVWTWPELQQALGADAAFFAKFYDVTPGGNWRDDHAGKDVNVLNRLNPLPANADDELKLTELRARLFTTRAQRTGPALDDKILADWNGLLLTSLVHAATSFVRPDWLEEAVRAYHCITESMVGEGDRLCHSIRETKKVFPGFALDHAAMMNAALALHEADPNAQNQNYLSDARRWAEIIHSHHRDPRTGLLCMAADDAKDIYLRLSPTTDDAIPNAHGLYIQGLTKLSVLTHEPVWLERADNLIAACASAVIHAPLGHTGVLNALDFRIRHKEIVIAGPESKPLLEAALSSSFLNRIALMLREDMVLPNNHPAHAQRAHAGLASAFICSEGTCTPPVSSAYDLKSVLI